MKAHWLGTAAILLLSSWTWAAPVPITDAPTGTAEEFDPFAPDAAQKLDECDKAYNEQKGPSPETDLPGDPTLVNPLLLGCWQGGCRVFAHVVKSTQQLYLSIDGVPSGAWPVSTGVAGHRTPDFDTHPDGRIYDRYSSDKYPGGNYNGLGNMPYAVFIRGGFAIHGTPASNWAYLGRPASHGCIRLHPDHAYTFNRLVRASEVANVWITVED